MDPMMTMAALLPNTNSDECEIKPGIAEMIREEERVSGHGISLFFRQSIGDFSSFHKIPKGKYILLWSDLI